MAEFLTFDTDLTAVANAIRAKGGTSAQLVYPSGFVSAIQAIQTGITPKLVVTTSAGAAVTAGKAPKRSRELPGQTECARWSCRRQARGALRRRKTG